MAATIRGLDHLQLAMPTEGEPLARAFYGTLLGLPEIDKPAPLAARGGVWFQLANQQLHLGVESPFTPAKKAHPGIAVEGLSALGEHLKAAGYTLTWDSLLPGYRRFYTTDPFGNRLEFLEPS